MQAHAWSEGIIMLTYSNLSLIPRPLPGFISVMWINMRRLFPDSRNNTRSGHRECGYTSASMIEQNIISMINYNHAAQGNSHFFINEVLTILPALVCPSNRLTVMPKVSNCLNRMLHLSFKFSLLCLKSFCHITV